jgi:DNA-binding MarR family transcriptional regulator
MSANFTESSKLVGAPCEPLPEVLATRVGFLLNRAAMRIRQMTEGALAPLNIFPKHYGLMAVIKANGPTTQQAIGDVLKVDRTTMVLLVDDAESKDIVIRNPHPTDRRCYLLGLSENGQKVYEKAHRLVKKVEDEFFGVLKEQEKDNLITLLGKLFQNSDSELKPTKKSAETV